MFLMFFYYYYFSYPPEETIYRSYNERWAWEKLKSTQLQSVMNTVQEKCIRHNVSFTESTSEVKRPLTPARVDSTCPSTLEKFDQYMSFVYGSHKVPEGGSSATSSATKTCSTLQNSATKEKNCTLSHQQDERKSVTFAFCTTEWSEWLEYSSFNRMHVQNPGRIKTSHISDPASSTKEEFDPR